MNVQTAIDQLVSTLWKFDQEMFLEYGDGSRRAFPNTPAGFRACAEAFYRSEKSVQCVIYVHVPPSLLDVLEPRVVVNELIVDEPEGDGSAEYAAQYACACGYWE